MTLIAHTEAERSVAGVVVAVSVVVMPLRARAKRRAASEIGSGALHADARPADFGAYLSAILLAGLLLNRLLGWWWADPAAGLSRAGTGAVSRWFSERCGLELPIEENVLAQRRSGGVY